MVLSPLPTHESILREINKMLTKTLATIPISEKIMSRTVTGNTPFIGQSIFGIPDLMVLTAYRDSLKERQQWIMESAFSQRDKVSRIDWFSLGPIEEGSKRGRDGSRGAGVLARGTRSCT